MTPTAEPENPFTLSVKLLGILALMALAWSVYEGVALGLHGGSLKTPLAPQRIVSLALAPTEGHAQAILDDWQCGQQSGATPATTPCAAALEGVAMDYRFIAAYAAAWVLIPLWASIAGHTSRKVMALVIAAVVIGALFDLAENRLLAQALTNTSAIEPARLFRLLRLAAMNKFVFLLFGIAGGIVLGFGALRKVVIQHWLWKMAREKAEAERRRAHQPTGGSTAGTERETDQALPALSSPTFDELVRLETRGIFAMYERRRDRTADTPDCALNEAADERYVSFREADLIGLALSGGGIRSATFNLGLLQELHCLKLLPLVDYLSTVSGGGYIGSFWSAWLTRLPALLKRTVPGLTEDSPDWTAHWNDRLFPTVRDLPPGQPHRVESDEERHLREFSGFLAPRWGFFEIDTWTAIVALLAGLVPALLIGWSVIGMTLVAWLALTFPLASSEADGAPALTVALVTLLVFILFERMWQVFRRETAATGDDRTTRTPLYGGAFYLTWVVIVVLLVAALQFGLRTLYTSHPQGPWPVLTRVDVNFWHEAPDASGIVRWWAITGIDNPGQPWIFSPRLFDYGLVWVTAALVLIGVRTTSAILPRPWRRESLATFDRVLMRTLGMGSAWIGLALLWHVSVNLPGLATVGVSAAISGGLFAALRNWIGLALRRPAEAGVLDRLKPMLPALLAYLTLVLTTITVGGVLVVLGGTDWFAWWLAAAAMTTMLVVALFISPDQFGMHAFYRDRIARAYPGAANLAAGQGAAGNRGTEPREGDDPKFTDLVTRPLHLVCCAANDLSGDQVETLNRGARSAVLSRYGFSFGRHAHEWHEHSPSNRLASGVTASAAAFNSNMGHISVRVGPAVSFLMTMLNLRLGLWVRHPLAVQAGPRRWPGLLYYREMLGLTSSSGRMSAEELPKSVMRDIHLSDGGHFENLALYELVRRHCRYIIVSDCGADPDVAFDDLGNALRRIREDFGVDVELDVAPLRPDAKRISRQHVAVGRIKYSETDTGILLYIKPSITGDEPPDVLQYRARNLEFPHEATTDQFYDEAQWESYRRLGRHAVEHIFAFIRRDGIENLTADSVFAAAARHWGPTPEGLADKVLEMTRRFAAVDAELQQRQQQNLLEQVFPEMADTVGIKQLYARDRVSGAPQATETTGTGAATASGRRGHQDPEAAMAAELSILLKVMQVMEDVWMACELDRWWSHPLNLGWINLFARWATSPPFQFWWPLMAPMFSPGFRQFVEQRFPMPGSRIEGAALDRQADVTEVEAPAGSGLAAIWWAERSAQLTTRWAPAPLPFRRRYYERRLDLRRGDSLTRIQVGLAAVTFRGRIAGWSSDDFFVPPSLWGAGIGGRFLDGLLERASLHATRCIVVVKAPPPQQAHQVARDDRQAFLEHYKRVGFRVTLPKAAGKTAATRGPRTKGGLRQQLSYDWTRDTLLTLDLDQWRARNGLPPLQRSRR